jgi:hypothetical protein
MVPILPSAYPGPALHTDSLAQPKNSFMLTAGMGIPTLGKLGFDDVSGLGHAFGV